ncbi:tRNA (guanine-N(7)-)-methyltransferase [Porphyridium purpureum]|uniref:tRNA (guanine(46)-N(7))-methyltransferase n=1 Tax=Porphyridium purpureum TaxID=35688 RepID=A0A5J4Z497_PORPP|nr:tRNA (guanine-N(7)-)-methyltransferase [Porphyridium purpureum]|eukprot:POR8319..scf208_2
MTHDVPAKGQDAATQNARRRKAAGLRSYRRQSARDTSKAQRRVLQQLYPHYTVAVEVRSVEGARSPVRRLSWGHEQAGRPLHIEIGSGSGEVMLALAERHSGANILGIEVHKPSVAAIVQKLHARAAHLTNVRVLRMDAMTMVAFCIEPSSVDAVHVYFPDPFPEAHDRRLLRPYFIELLADALVLGGQLNVATDDAHYAASIRDLLSQFDSHFEEQMVHERPDWRPISKYEGKALREGRTEIFEFKYILRRDRKH